MKAILNAKVVGRIISNIILFQQIILWKVSTG